MPVVKVNLGEAQGVVGAGSYLLEVEDIDTKKVTRQNKLEMFQVRSRVVEPEDLAGKAHFENLIQTEDSVWTTDRFLRALGIEVPEDKAARASFEFDTDELIGKQFVAIIEPQPNNALYTQTVALLTVEQAEAQGIEYGVAKDEDEDEED